tara:strand:- start:44 stop:853 length:810 start_codon:yes stop_codon:yes gene_type:complete
MGIPLYGQNKAGNAIDEAANDRKQTYRFGTLPVIVDGQHTVNQLPDGTAGDKVIHQYADGLSLTACYLGSQTLDNPAADTSGMNYSLDAADDEGISWVMSDEAVKGREGIDRFTVGKQAFSASLKFSLADVSDTDDCAFGFRKVEAHQANLDDYDEMAAWNIISGDIKIETILNADTTSTHDITNGGGDGAGNWADAGAHTLKVSVDKAGAVTYTIDGVAPTAATSLAFSFDDGEVVTPFGYHLHAAASTMGIVLQELVIESDNGSMEA